ncbi:hypothetical protein TFLX_04609 [Thermoflexales bacterium]|nr:hypothetical protein TFLX_04609 [Thermoflexales bacterium]
MSLFKCLFKLAFVSLLFAACTTLEVGVEQKPHSLRPTPTRKAAQVAIATATDADVVATALARLTITPSPTPTPDVRVYVGTPQPGALYWGFAEEKPVLFAHERNSSQDPNLGVILHLDGSNRWSFDFQKLSSPYVVYTGEAQIELIQAKLDGWEKFVYVSFITNWLAVDGNTTPANYNRLIEINLKTLTHRELWTHDIMDDTYPDFHGAAIVEEIFDPHQMVEAAQESKGRFLVLRLLPCHGCEPTPPHAMLVLNVDTGREVYLGKVGNVNIDFIEKVVSYQNLGEQRVKCEPNPLCGPDGYMTLYEPTGDLQKQPLP